MSETDLLLPPPVEENIESDKWDFSTKAVAKEAKTLFSLSWPVTAANLFNFSITSASVFSLGHVGTEYLGAAALSLLLCNVTGLAISQGMASALDTLCSQSFTGSNDRFALGKHLQRGLFLALVTCIPISVLWWFTEPVMILLGQKPEVARISGIFSRWMLPGLYPIFVAECLRRYLQAQAIMKPAMLVTIVAAPLAIFLQWFLVFSPYAIGFEGAALATSTVNIFIAVALALYIRFVEGSEVWGGWDLKEMLDGKLLFEYLCLGLPGVAMICSEWLAFEACSLAAGIIGETALATQTIVLNTCGLLYMIPLGLGVATTTRIGNCLGSNLPFTTKKVAWTAMICSFFTAAFNATFIMSARTSWGYLFSSDIDVIELVAAILPLAAIYQISESTGVIAGSALRGCGLQKYGAYLNLIGYYILAIPLGLLLAFKFELGLLGLWIGLSLGLFFVGFCEIIILCYMDWPLQAANALKRINYSYTPVDTEVTEP
ncbi:hypothetical protein HK103_001476 [Boothiomyces macroporosus]|uniref:MATE efflux family protein n=1 Tax=Boothiomyces macroporosus TaxID=261099 RepID=A0AAD5Y746_9FUNG|nr:hypothetical protein HK103_001476 [Boothiomyces macroporosus]